MPYLLSSCLSFFSSPGAHAQSADSAAKNIQVPQGFRASVVAEHLDGARHLAVTRQGVLYIKLGRLKDGKGIVCLQDTNGDGTFDRQTLFGDYPGTGIYVKEPYLYASSNDDVFRYKLDEKGLVTDTSHPEKIISGLVNRNRDNSKSITVDNKGNIYVNVGSYLNACLTDTASKVAPNPCPLLDSAGASGSLKPTN